MSLMSKIKKAKQIKKVKQVDVGVWDFKEQCFIEFVPCPGEKRVRIDVLDSLNNYAVYPGRYEGKLFFPTQPPVPLRGWKIDLT